MVVRLFKNVQLVDEAREGDGLTGCGGGPGSEFLVEVGSSSKSEMVNTAEKPWRDDREWKEAVTGSETI